MARALVLSTLLAAAAAIALVTPQVAHAGNVFHADGGRAAHQQHSIGKKYLFEAGAAVVPNTPSSGISGPSDVGYWTNLFAPPYTDCPSIMIGISCTNNTNCYIPAGTRSDGYGIMRFDGQPGGRFTSMPMRKKPVMLVTLDVGAADKGIPMGSAGGMGFGTGIQYLSRGVEWFPSNTTEAMQLTQCIRTSPDGRQVISVITEGEQAVMFSRDGGANFATIPINVPYIASGTSLRYAAIPSASVWYVTAGNWPTVVADGEHHHANDGLNVFNKENNKKTAAVYGNLYGDASAATTTTSFALSDTVAIVRDHKTGSVTLRTKAAVMSELEANMKASSAAQHNPPPAKLSSPTTANVGNLTGYAAQIFRTTDGGNSWKSVFAAASDFYLNGIECVNETRCYAVGTGSEAVYIYGTEDGYTWRKVYSLARSDQMYASLMSIGVVNGLIIAAGGAQKGSSVETLIIVSRDGIKWERQAPIDGIVDITALSFTPDGYGFAAAVTSQQTSTLLAYRPSGAPTLPPTPTYATFTQTTCEDAKCSLNCVPQTFYQDVCMSAGDTASVSVQCDAEGAKLLQHIFAASTQCAGDFTEQSIPTNTCIASSTSGTYHINTCM